MAEKLLAGINVKVTDEGYLTDHSQWNKEVAAALAKEISIEELTEGHWKVIEFLLKDFQENGKLPTIRRVNKVGGIPTKDLYNLFPDGPLMKASKDAG